MSVNVSPSEAAGRSAPLVPGFVRARGGVRVTIAANARGSAPLQVAEAGGYRIRFPRAAGNCEGVLINTGGGVAGGDRMTLDAAVLLGAEATLTTQAAEKIYRSDGAAAELAIRLRIDSGSRLAWLPQEQILFDGARVRRELEVAMAVDARLSLLESVVFGRLATGERLESGSFADRWRIRRDGGLIFAEEVRLEGRMNERLARKAVGGGGRALATFLHVAPDAEARREEARAALERASSEWGVSAWNGMLLARLLSPDPQALRADLAGFLEAFGGRALPRSWQT